MFNSTKVNILDIKDNKVFFTIHNEYELSSKEYSIELPVILDFFYLEEGNEKYNEFIFSNHRIEHYTDLQNTEIYSNLRKKLTKIIKENAVDIIESYIELNMMNFDRFNSEIDFLNYISDYIDCDFNDNNTEEECCIYIKYPELKPFINEYIRDILDEEEYLIPSRIFFNYFLDRSELNIFEIAKKMKMNIATFERKIKHNFSFTREEMIQISKILKLSGNEFLTLFRD